MSDSNHKIFIGFDKRQACDFIVLLESIKKHSSRPIDVRGIELGQMWKYGYYSRPTEVRDGRLYDVISEAPMSTGFAISRFLTPMLAEYEGFALFQDCDQMFLSDPCLAFDSIDTSKAVTCVKHEQPVDECSAKKTGDAQTAYARKNWSSFMLFNCEHPSNRKLTLDLVNSVPGRDLHRFCWLEDDEIGEFSVGWNHLVGVSQHTRPVHNVHWTLGSPTMPGYEKADYADEYFELLSEWVDSPFDL